VPLVPSAMLTEEPPARSPLSPEAGAAAERGRLIHRLLQSLPDMPPDERAEACRRFLARPALALAPDAREEIAGAALAVMANADFAPVFAPGSRAEVPIAGALPETDAILSGQIDRLAVTADSVLAVDYKTGHGVPTRPESVPVPYLRQMAAYRAGLRLIYPDHAIRCALLWTERPTLMALPDALLDAHAPA
jgi:ATP-dependent helicase/nuclease subunit A